MLKDDNNSMEQIIALAKRRGFVYPGSEIYGGLANSWDYGPLGVELKNNIKNRWWRKFVHERDDMVGLDAALIMNIKTWEASGHLKAFSDPLVECKKCHRRFRADELADIKKCQDCGGELTKAKQFNLMFKTYVGPSEDSASQAYLRPETAQAIFTNFKNILDTSRQRIPFGIAQVGKVFRNEITTGNFLFRVREFEQMEIEYFVREKDWSQHFEYWLSQMKSWLEDLNLSEKNIHFHEIKSSELAHYSKRTVDIEYKYPFGQKELYGLAYRTDYDLQQHMQSSGVDLRYRDPETDEKFVPHVIEPSLGVDRTFLAVLLEHYQEEGEGKEKRVVLKLPAGLAPYKVAVFPLLANKPQLVEKAREIYNEIKQHFVATWDERGNIGKRYYYQDEIGTPYAVTIDFDSLEDKKVTVRDRDSMKQERVNIAELVGYLLEKLS
jgi:glycyl-tRNA synthetase